MKPLLYTYIIIAVLTFFLATPICMTAGGRMSNQECVALGAGVGLGWLPVGFIFLAKLWR